MHIIYLSCVLDLQDHVDRISHATRAGLALGNTLLLRSELGKQRSPGHIKSSSSTLGSDQDLTLCTLCGPWRRGCTHPCGSHSRPLTSALSRRFEHQWRSPTAWRDDTREIHVLGLRRLLSISRQHSIRIVGSRAPTSNRE